MIVKNVELNCLAEEVDFNQVFTLLVNKKDLSAVTLVAGLMKSSFKMTIVFGMSNNIHLCKALK